MWRLSVIWDMPWLVRGPPCARGTCRVSGARPHASLDTPRTVDETSVIVMNDAA